MEKLNDLKKPKHEHKGTDILKVLIFSLVMLAPLFAILSKCLYTLNPNAKDSYYGETINETQYVKVNSYNELNNHNYTYQLILNSDNNTAISGTQPISYTSGVYIGGNVGLNTQSRINNSIRIILYFTNDTRTLEIVDANNESSYVSLATNSMIINIENPTLTQTSFEYWKQYIYRIEYNDYSYLDNVFYYSVEQVGNKQLFSWTKSTAIYGAVNGLTSGMGIDPTNNVLAILITYWSLTTAVYVVMDIVIELFKKLTHLIN